MTRRAQQSGRKLQIVTGNRPIRDISDRIVAGIRRIRDISNRDRAISDGTEAVSGGTEAVCRDLEKVSVGGRLTRLHEDFPHRIPPL